MNPANIIPILFVIIFVIIAGYRISLTLRGSAPRSTKMIIGIGTVVGTIVLVWGGLLIFHIIH